MIEAGTMLGGAPAAHEFLPVAWVLASSFPIGRLQQVMSIT